MSEKPVTVAVATYNDKASADQDYDAVHGIKHEGQIDHLAIAFVSKDADGKLKVDRHDTTAKHLAWGGAVLGGALTVIAEPLGIVFLSGVLVNAGVVAGVGGIVGHFWHNIPKDEVQRMSDLLENGQYGLVVVAVNPKGANVDALLSNAVEKVITEGTTDSDGALDEAFATAEA